MILRPPEPPPATTGEFVSPWPVIERLQKQHYKSCWMITQPSHAALAGDIAARLRDPQIPKLDADLIRAIALHDAGWGMPDAQAIMRSRSDQRDTPKSFLETEVAEFLAAWSQSIDVVQPVSPAGGYMVSRHFWRLAEHRMAHGNDAESDRRKLKTFLDHESQRQKKLAAKQNRSIDKLERLTDLLQFCDLLSLYICSGARDNAQFPEYFGFEARLRVEPEGYKLGPPLLENGSPFRVAALRHPAIKEESSREIVLKIW
jgi:Protein of unknown function (DUF3891)